MIEIDITKRLRTYSGADQLRVKTTIATGQVTGIFGPSGSGKSTFLKILAGLVQPEQGLIRVQGETWLDTAARISLPPQQRRVGFVFQDYALFPNMTVEQHLHYGTRDNGYVQRLLRLGRMETFAHHRPRQLSGGQQQRLAILRALSTRPGLLLMDEPFSALDRHLKGGLIPELKQLLTEGGTTCLIVTHYPTETEGFADHSFTME
ncbi:ATP-binding cassette domain-containing protein [Paraflavisolibacter sp. H34]|uniref:ATP-binding cassette domain-containing protein n=1 Tax=Huijunlia imazamoxiresistens TaxID=3127457 RepID=UPI0030171202